MSDGTLMGGDVAPQQPEVDAAPAEQQPDVNAAANVQEPTEVGVPDWVKGFEGHDQLGDDILSNPSLKALKSPTDLLKSYVNAQKMIGADKVVLPNKNSTPEEWLQLYHKMGMPTDFEGYSLEKGEKAILNEDFYNTFKEAAFKNNLLPNQAQALFDIINNQSLQEYERQQAEQKEMREAAINGLREEWGDGFERNLQAAKVAVEEFGGDELRKYLNDTGMGNDPQLIKAFSKIGQDFLKEDTFEGESKSAYAMTPDEAQAKANEIMGDFDGPYYNSSHPDHKRIVNEVNKLFKMMSPQAS